MGAGWRRFSEQAKQKWHLGGGPDFVATPNTRNEMMLQEAGEFASHLKKIEKDIRGLKNATENILLSTKAVLSAPLPRVYEETQGGKVVPLNASNAHGGGALLLPIGGTDFNAEELAKISKETSKKLESEVLAPMERWMNAYALVQNRMNKLESLRLEVDSRRRTVGRLGKKVDMQRARLPQTRAKGEYEMENTIKVLQHKESKLSACRQSFKEHEALVYHQLTNLIRDTVWLKSYLSAVLRVQTEAFQAANVALGQMRTAALPAPSDMAGVPTGVAASIPSTPEALTSGRDATPPHLQANMNDVTRKLQRKDINGGSMAVSASALGSKDSLYTIQDAPAAPQHRIPAAPSQGGYDRYGEQAYGRSAVQAAW
ncbi:TBC1 domain family member 2A [Micractinium conductrix]|uniref:TBC1 domain family member 2A n=1 Tax=Micractinium conductrix TaxID=554055 RepID=A0A2P6V554_9CHLO|nr:TBC1 domain family member 2A [Micractinium conductrix]|eukprot:PSC69221.1 TBC1 domain family member 2A [Micractinium conductrix]